MLTGEKLEDGKGETQNEATRLIMYFVNNDKDFESDVENSFPK